MRWVSCGRAAVGPLRARRRPPWAGAGRAECRPAGPSRAPGGGAAVTCGRRGGVADGRDDDGARPAADAAPRAVRSAAAHAALCGDHGHRQSAYGLLQAGREGGEHARCRRRCGPGGSSGPAGRRPSGRRPPRPAPAGRRRRRGPPHGAVSVQRRARRGRGVRRARRGSVTVSRRVPKRVRGASTVSSPAAASRSSTSVRVRLRWRRTRRFQPCPAAASRRTPSRTGSPVGSVPDTVTVPPCLRQPAAQREVDQGGGADQQLRPGTVVGASGRRRRGRADT